MIRSRVYGIRAGYEDENDHDTLRTDPVFKLVADCSPEDNDLASHLRASGATHLRRFRSLGSARRSHRPKR
jgi:hypothetical protein